MRIRFALTAIAAIVRAAVVAVTFIAPGQAIAAGEVKVRRLDVSTRSNVLDLIADCLAKNEEAVLFPTSVDCAPYRQGKVHFRNMAADAPFDYRHDADCPKGGPSEASVSGRQRTPPNAKRLPPNAIAQLVTDKKFAIGSHGIRILGAIFCERVNLVGLEFPSAVVLDKSVFKEGIEIRNVRAKGDFSVDGSLVFKSLTIVRSHIEGSFFGDETFIHHLSVLDTAVEGAISLQESVLFQRLRIDGANAKEISVRASALSHFMVQFSRITGLLDLSHSEARCAYHINKSEIGFLIAKKAGFGSIEAPPLQAPEGVAWHSWRRKPSESVEKMLQSQEVKSVVSDKEGCITQTDRVKAQFFLFDSRVTSSLCIAEFEWLAPHDGAHAPANFFNPRNDGSDPITLIAINGNSIGNNVILDLWPRGDTVHDKVSEKLHQFEAIGLRAGGLVLNFQSQDSQGNKRKYRTAVDGIEFDRIYDARAVCDFVGSKTVPLGDRKIAIITDFTEQLQVPNVADVLRWLELNDIRSTQPFTAFASAFEKAGAESAQIKIARANREVCDRAAHWLLVPLIKPLCPTVERYAQSAWTAAAWGGADRTAAPIARADSAGGVAGPLALYNAVMTIPDQLGDLAQLVFRGALYWLADHGYRPGKVIWWTALTLVVFWLVFVFKLKVVAFEPNEESTAGRPAAQTSASPAPKPPTLKPIGFIFLFDRLLPNYRIVTSNYEIRRYYKRIHAPAAATVSRASPMRRLRFLDWFVVPVDDPEEIARIEKWLVALRLLGLVYTLFLAAAIGALIVR